MTVTDYPDWQTPAAHAAQIAVTGVPLLRLTNNLAFGAAVPVAGGATVNLLAGGSVNQPGYEMTITVSMPAASGTRPFLHLELIWQDSTSSLFGFRRDVVLACGNAAGNVLTYYLHGPMHSDMFNVSVVNLDPAVTATVAFTINATSHVYEEDHATQFAYAAVAPIGYNNPLGTPTTNVVARENASIPVSSSFSVLCALYSGDVILTVDATVQTVATVIALQDPTGLAAGSVNGTVFRTSVAGGATLAQPLALPFAPMNLVVTNGSATVTINPVITIIGQQH